MKKRINKFIFVLAALVLFATSCEWEPIMWDDSKTYIAFNTPTTVVPEEGGPVGIVVMVTALEGAPAVDVTFQMDTVGISPTKAAIEGEQYELVNADQTLSFPGGWGFDTIWIQPIDNDVFTGDKLFNLTLTANSVDYAFGAQAVNKVTVKDNEHPLATWIGTYSVEAISYANPGAWDEAWAVTTEPDPDDVSNLIITIDAGGGPGSPFTATLDKEAMTITITEGSDAGNIYGYGSTTIWYGIYPDRDESVPLVGDLQEDGTILIDGFAMYLPAYAYYWDAFNTTWTKTAKKSGNVVKINQEKASRIN